jgi:hypothetical protein
VLTLLTILVCHQDDFPQILLDISWFGRGWYKVEGEILNLNLILALSLSQSLHLKESTWVVDLETCLSPHEKGEDQRGP